jgi:hypothetical protein
MIPRLLLVLAALLFGTAAFAHEVRPAYLEITQTAANQYRILWKQPVVGDRALPLQPQLSTGWTDGTAQTVELTPTHLLKIWTVNDPQRTTLDGLRIRIAGLDTSITDVLLRATPLHGETITLFITPEAPESTLVLEHGSQGLAVAGYLPLGFDHMLEGFDHLAFILGLLLLIGIRWSLLAAITAFTVAHSITLAFAALGVVHPRSAEIETLVALSIVFVALEACRAAQGRTSLAIERPWLVAFLFGLLHGLAFAGALSQIGLPQEAVPQALFLFNVGVELGQITFVTAVVLVLLVVRKLFPITQRVGPQAQTALAYGIGGLAMFWCLERVTPLFAR